MKDNRETESAFQFFNISWSQTSLRGRRSKGKGEGEFEREARSWGWVVGGESRFALELPQSHDRASRSNSPSPFPFERRPRRLESNWTRDCTAR